MQPLRLRKFSGDRGQPAEDFIKEIELMLTLCPMDNGPACLQIIGALEGRARTVYGSGQSRASPSREGHAFGTLK